jgi:predicted amidohydrolase
MPRELYTKQFLHADELPFFTPGIPLTYSLQQKHIALAICYELSVPEHALHAHERSAQIYVASVAKTAKGVEKASKELAEIAKRYSMTVLMVNSIGVCEDGECAGQSAVWNNQGEIIQQLNHTEEGLLLLNSHT